MSYDENGNIMALQRRGLLANATRAVSAQFGPVDDLTYAYTGNRLLSVQDQVTTNQLPRPINYHGAPTSLAGDFQEAGVRLGTEYLYDNNGNLTRDKNKGITAIAYNHLNLPRLIHFGIGADSLVFRYTASGQKVAKLVYQTGKLLQRTDYLGPYQYEQDSLRFFPHAEGRVLRFVSYDAARQPTTRYEREFTVKDHLGNLRLAYRLGQVRTYLAGLEPHDAARETHQFDSLSVSAPIAQDVSAVGSPPRNLARTGNYAAKLNAGGTAPQPLGPFTQFQVQKGDTIRVSAPGLYPQATRNSSFAFSLASFVAALLNPAPVTPASIDGTRRGGIPLLQIGLNAAALNTLAQLPDGVPKGYLRVLSFNEDSVLVDQRTVQLSAAALGNYETLSTGPLVVQQNGYVSVYVGNESAADVYFDDVTIEHRQGLQVQENQYDPFGVTLVGVNHAGALPENKYQFNGKEQERELGLNWQDFNWRHYDPATARFFGVDRLAEKFVYLTDYQFASNNPTSKIELDGLEGAWAQTMMTTVMEGGKSISNVIREAYNSTSVKLEINYTFGPQMGVEIGTSKVDLTVASMKLGSESVSLDKGNLSSSQQVLGVKRTADNQGEKVDNTAGVEVKNKVGIKLLGLGYEVGQSQVISDGMSKDAKTYQKASIYKGGRAVTVTKETAEDGTVKVSGEQSYTVGAKFILGIEVKISDSAKKSKEDRKLE